MAEASASTLPGVLRTQPQRPLNRTSNDAVTFVPPVVSSKLTTLSVRVNLVSPSDSALSGGESLTFLSPFRPLLSRDVSSKTESPSLFNTFTALPCLDHFGMASKSVYVAKALLRGTFTIMQTSKCTDEVGRPEGAH